MEGPEVRIRPGYTVGFIGGYLRVEEDARVNAALRVCVVCEGRLEVVRDPTVARLAHEPGRFAPAALGCCRRCNLIYVLED